MASLFQVPQPSLGLMGRQRSTRNRMPPGMAGMGGMTLEDILLNVPQSPQPPPADAIDEAMMARRAEDERLAAAASAPSRPRERVGFGSVLGRVLAPATFEAIDAERARLQAMADQPRAQAIAMENERIARAMGPQALLALRLNGEQLGAQVSEGFGTDVVAAGSGLFSGGRRVGEQSTFAESGDQVLERNSQGVRPVYTREMPSITERTAIDRNAIDRERLDLDSRTAGYELSPGQSRFGLDNQPVASVAPAPRERVIPDAVRRDNEKDQAAIDAREAVTARLENSIAMIDNNLINLDPASRASAWVRNSTGNSSDQSRAQAELRRTVEAVRNGILNDATGPQTDGDSLRALNQILQGWGDERVVREGLAAYVAIQRGKTDSQRRIMEGRMAGFGGAGAATAERPRAVNPATGETIEFDGQAWVPVT